MGRLSIIALVLIGVAAVTAAAVVINVAEDYEDGSTSYVVYSESDTGLVIYTDDGITVSVSEGSKKTTLVATLDDGIKFDGWYDSDGELLSSETTYSAKLSEGDVIYAYAADYTTVDAGATVDLAELLGVSGEGTFTVSTSDYDGSSATVSGSSAVFASVGIYTVTYSEDGTYVCARILSDDEIEITYEWSYSSSDSSSEFNKMRKRPSSSKSEQEFEFTLSILYSDYIHYVNVYTEDERICYYTNVDKSNESIAHDTSFVNYDSVQDTYIQALADYIASQTEGKSDQYIANVILAFVQTVTYEYDSDVYGTEEYWQFPLETLFLNSGDCEDTSILFCAIASSMGYDSCLFLFNGHMAAGISIDEFSATRSSSSSVKSGVYGFSLTTTDGETETSTMFYYGETTSTGWLLGEIPSSIYKSYITGFVVYASTTE